MTEPYKAASTYRMPFGKFKGHMLCVIEASYLEWLERELLAEGRNTSDELMIEIRKELKQRGGKK